MIPSKKTSGSRKFLELVLSLTASEHRVFAILYVNLLSRLVLFIITRWQPWLQASPFLHNKIKRQKMKVCPLCVLLDIPGGSDSKAPAL